MGFALTCAAVILAAAAAAVLLYAFALWFAVREESFISTVWNVAKQVFTGEFWT